MSARPATLAAALALALLAGPARATGNLCTSQRCVVYASSDTDLYQVDPATLQLTHLCAFSGAVPAGAPVTDLAVAADGSVYGVTEQALYRIDPQSCVTTLVATLSTSTQKWVCLAFTASGTLVAADTTGDVVTIDPASGVVSSAGSFGGSYGCSGDMVALDDASQTIYASATDATCTATTCTDLLVTLDPANGYAATVVGDTGHRGVFGLGYWAGVIYGFTHGGLTLQIDPASGASHTLGSTSPVVKFSGGGTTPLAPTCTNPCSPGQTQCSGTDVQTCTEDLDGCLNWTTARCPANQACQGTACAPLCTDACTAGATQCARAGLQTCLVQADGCLDWSTSPCPSGQSCQGSACAPSCSNACNPGQTQCSGNTVQACAQGADGCWAWVDDHACAFTEICASGACAATCTDACTAGAAQCSGALVQTCAVAQSGCTEWQNGADCGTAGCVGGACCECVVGQTRCGAGGGVEACVGDAPDACPTWVAQPCASNACLDGACLVACTPGTEVDSCGSGAVCAPVQGGDYCVIPTDGGYLPATTGGSGSSSSSSSSGSSGPAGTSSGSGTSSSSSSGSGSGGTTGSSGAGASGSSGSAGTAGLPAGSGSTSGGLSSQGPAGPARRAATSTGCGCSAGANPGLELALALLGALSLRRRR